MERFGFVDANGSPIYTASPAIDGVYTDGGTYGDQTAWLLPVDAPDDITVLATYYYKDGWQVRESRPASYYEWNNDIEEWVGNLTAAKEAKNAQINTARIDYNSTFQFLGKTIASDLQGRSYLDAVGGFTNMFSGLPENFAGYWKAVDNTNLAIPDMTTMLLMYSEMTESQQRNFNWSESVKSELAGATTVEQVESISLVKGSVSFPTMVRTMTLRAPIVKDYAAIPKLTITQTLQLPGAFAFIKVPVTILSQVQSLHALFAGVSEIVFAPTLGQTQILEDPVIDLSSTLSIPTIVETETLSAPLIGIAANISITTIVETQTFGVLIANSIDKVSIDSVLYAQTFETLIINAIDTASIDAVSYAQTLEDLTVIETAIERVPIIEFMQLQTFEDATLVEV
jgi:hypothetical protein